MDLQLLWTIQLAPLAAFLLIQILPKGLKKIAPFVAILFAGAAAAASIRLLWTYARGEGLSLQFIHPWLYVSDARLWPMVSVPHYALEVGFLLDHLNLLMITIVTTITFFVHLFSYYYMSDDESPARYFGFLSFFAFAMTGLVLSSNLLQTFLFWELVGLASYLLIGFWYQKKSASDAARKAFVLNRLADLGFYLGIILLFLLTGSVNFFGMTTESLAQSVQPHTLTLLGILIFMGVMGKSAQFPFHVWLPDAMEGPTPVSALIHSATMVAAGVFLLSRAFPLFAASNTTLHVILIFGALTAATGALLATVQRDIKKIMAYSTVSQLGLMVMAVGSGSAIAAIFHLSTHAFFKSMLFLTAGAFIHRFHTNDIWEIAKEGGKKETLPLIALIIGLFSLCGIFPFSGFYSKDLILESLRHENSLFYILALFVSFLTVFYSFRLLFVILRTKIHSHSHDVHHASLAIQLCKALPLIGLAILSIIAGLLGTSVFDFKLLRWLGGHETELNKEILMTTTLLILSGAGLAYARYKDPELALKRLSETKNPVIGLLQNKFYIDDAYVFVVKRVGLAFASLLDAFDRLFVNGVLVNGTSYFILYAGRFASKIQSGLLQDYLSWGLGVGLVILFWVVRGLP